MYNDNDDDDEDDDDDNNNNHHQNHHHHHHHHYPLSICDMIIWIPPKMDIKPVHRCVIEGMKDLH